MPFEGLRRLPTLKSRSPAESDAETKYFVVFFPLREQGRRFVLRKKTIVLKWNPAVACTRPNLETADRLRIYMNVEKPDDNEHNFSVFASCVVLSCDIAADCLGDLNMADKAARGLTSAPYEFLCRTLGGLLKPGCDFVVNADCLSQLEETHHDERLDEIERSVKTLAAALNNRMEKIEGKLDQALESRKDQEYCEMLSAAKEVELPLPFSNFQAAELFLSTQLHMDAAVAAFNANEKVLGKKRELRVAERVGKSVQFSAATVMSFLYTPSALDHLIGHKFGDASKDFLCGRSRFLMGSDWSVTDSWIISRLRKHGAYQKKRKK